MSGADAAAEGMVCEGCLRRRGDPRGYVLTSMRRSRGKHDFDAKCLTRTSEVARSTADFVREYLPPRAHEAEWLRIGEEALRRSGVPAAVTGNLLERRRREPGEGTGSRASAGSGKKGKDAVFVLPRAKLERHLRTVLVANLRLELARALRPGDLGARARGGHAEFVKRVDAVCERRGRARPTDPLEALLVLVSDASDRATPVDVFAELFPGGSEGSQESMLRWLAWSVGKPWGRGARVPTRDLHSAVRDIWRGGAHALAHLGYRAGAYVLFDRSGDAEKTGFVYSPEWLQGMLEEKVTPGKEMGLDALLCREDGVPDTKATKATSYGAFVRKYFRAADLGLSVRCGERSDGKVKRLSTGQRPFIGAFESRTDSEVRHGMMLVPDGEMSFRALELYCALRSPGLKGRRADGLIDKDMWRFLEAIGLVLREAPGGAPATDGRSPRPTRRTYRMFQWLDAALSSRAYARLRKRDSFLTKFAGSGKARQMIKEWCAGFRGEGARTADPGSRKAEGAAGTAAGPGSGCLRRQTCGECSDACGKEGASRLCEGPSRRLFQELVRALVKNAENCLMEGQLFNVMGHAALRRCRLDAPLFPGVGGLGQGGPGKGASFEEERLLDEFRSARRKLGGEAVKDLDRKLDPPCLDRGMVAFPLFDLGDRGCYAQFSVVGASDRMLVREREHGESFDIDYFARFERAARSVGTPWATDDFRGRVAPRLEGLREAVPAVSPAEWKAVRQVPDQAMREALLEEMRGAGEMPPEFLPPDVYRMLPCLHVHHLPGGGEATFRPWFDDPERESCPVLWRYALAAGGRDILSREGYGGVGFSYGELKDWRRPPVRAIVNDDNKAGDLSRCVELWRSDPDNARLLADVRVFPPFQHDYLWFNAPRLLESIQGIAQNAAGACRMEVAFCDLSLGAPGASDRVDGFLARMWNVQDVSPRGACTTFNPLFPGTRTMEQEILPTLARTGALWLFYSGATKDSEGCHLGHKYKVLMRKEHQLSEVGAAKDWRRREEPPTFALFIPAETRESRWRGGVPNVWDIRPLDYFGEAGCTSLARVMGDIDY